MKPEFVSCRKSFQAHVRNLPVRQGDHRAIDCADTSGAKADLLDGADRVADLQGVANVNRLIGNEGDTGDKILECLLCRESNCDTSHSNTCEGGSRVYSK